MIRTNSKKAKERIREYLMEDVRNMMDEREIETETPVTEYMKIMNEEAKYGCVNRKANEFDRFVYWLQGLAGFGADVYYFGGKTEYGYSKCREILADWLEQTTEEANKYSDSKCEELMVWLTYRELKAMERKETKGNA